MLSAASALGASLSLSSGGGSGLSAPDETFAQVAAAYGLTVPELEAIVADDELCMAAVTRDAVRARYAESTKTGDAEIDGPGPADISSSSSSGSPSTLGTSPSSRGVGKVAAVTAAAAATGGGGGGTSTSSLLIQDSQPILPLTLSPTRGGAPLMDRTRSPTPRMERQHTPTQRTSSRAGTPVKGARPLSAAAWRARQTTKNYRLLRACAKGDTQAVHLFANIDQDPLNVLVCGWEGG